MGVKDVAEVDSDDFEEELLEFDDDEDVNNEEASFFSDDVDSSSDEDSIESEEEIKSNSSESSCSESEKEAPTAKLALIAKAPQVLEPALQIQTIPGVNEVKTSSFRLCGDNIDKTIRRRFLRSDISNTSLHYFHSYAVLNRVDFS